jgi:predicted O-methyltransferase YrrM
MATSDTALLRHRVQKVLERLHTLADEGDDSIIQHALSVPTWQSATDAQKATLLKDVFMPVSRDAGRFLYGVARSIRAKQIVEFGSSFGISTIYFAAALHDNGGGMVIGSELEAGKVAKATEHLAEAGLADCAEIRAGDARHTLKDTGGAIDLLFLDGWKELYLELLRLMSADLRPGSVVLADDTDLFPEQLAPYLEFIRDPKNGFVSVPLPLGDGIEYSVRL